MVGFESVSLPVDLLDGFLGALHVDATEYPTGDCHQNVPETECEHLLTDFIDFPLVYWVGLSLSQI